MKRNDGMGMRAALTLGLGAALWLGGMEPAAAGYRSDDLNSDTELLDYIENARRSARENRVTEEQLQLLHDAQAMQGRVKGPLAADRPPIAVEGDDMFYDQATGDVYAKGHVRITSLDARRFKADEVKGNLKEQVIKIDDWTHLLQMTPDEPRAAINGYRAVYNYGSRTGSIEEVSGKYGRYYIYGKRIEFYPDKILIYEGYQTKCGAKVPDYRLSGDLIEIYPGKELLIHEVKYWVKNKVVYARSLYRQDLSQPEKGPNLPRVGYDSDDGVWIAQKFDWQITPRLNAYADLRYYNRVKEKHILGLEWQNGGSWASLQYGEFNDSDNRWIKKEPNFRYQYTDRLADLPLTYALKYEIGRWSDRFTSTHTQYGLMLTPDPLPLGRTCRLLTDFGYEVTKESFDGSTVKGFNYHTTLLKDMGKDVTAYARYSYAKANIQNSLFAYNVEDYSHKLSFGLSWAFTDRDRIVIGESFDMGRNRQEDVDYYWFHDMHCAQLILRYRAKRDTWHVGMQFTPW